MTKQGSGSGSGSGSRTTLNTRLLLEKWRLRRATATNPGGDS